MAALAGDMTGWTERGLEVARSFPEAAAWVGTLLNNLGWWHARRGEHAESLSAYRGSLEAYERQARYPYLRRRHASASPKPYAPSDEPKRRLHCSSRPWRGPKPPGTQTVPSTRSLPPPTPDSARAEDAAEQERLSQLAGPGEFALWKSRPPPPRSDRGS